MIFVEVTSPGEHGVVKDLSPDAYRQVPINVWTDARGVVFEEGVAKKARGLEVAFNTQVEPLEVMFIPGTLTSHYIYADRESIYARDVEGNEGNITRSSGPYNGSLEHRWHLADFNGVPIFNNGVDTPQAWLDQDVRVPLVDLPAWPENVTAGALRPFKYHLVALNIKKSSGTFPRMVKWSHTADPGTVPASWDETDPAVDAGEVVLVPGSDALVDCLPLGDVNIIYGETSTWAMRYVGGMSVFAFSQVSNTSGILALGTVADIGTGHFVVTDNDIVLLTQGGVQSIATPKVRSWFFRNLRAQGRHRVCVVPDRLTREVWILFPTGGTELDTALVWNWAYNTWTIRSLSGVMGAAAVGVARAAVDRWSGSSDDWNSGRDRWDIGAVASREVIGSIVLACADRTVKRPSRTVGETYSMLERKWLSIEPPPRVKRLMAIWPRFEAPTPTSFTITVRGRMHLSDETGPVVQKVYTTNEKKVDVYVTGRFFDIKFEHTGTQDWVLHGYALEVAEDLGWL
jgi:hypothetical protein